MKGPTVTLFLLGVDNPNDPVSSAVSNVRWMATPQGSAYVSLFGSGSELPIDSGGMIALIFEEEGLNVRSATFGLRYDSTGPFRLQNICSANMGELIDASIAVNTSALLGNSAVYGYDEDTDDGSLSVAWVSPFNASLNIAGYALHTISALYAMGATNPVRLESGSSSAVGAAASGNALLVQPPGEWTLTHAPVADTQATVTRGAPGVGSRNVLKSICADINAVAAIVAPLILVVRDGATGVGAILWTRKLTAPAGETKSVEISGLNIPGSENTAMTVEFTGAPGATNFETISVTGITAAD